MQEKESVMVVWFEHIIKPTFIQVLGKLQQFFGCQNFKVLGIDELNF